MKGPVGAGSAGGEPPSSSVSFEFSGRRNLPEPNLSFQSKEVLIQIDSRVGSFEELQKRKSK